MKRSFANAILCLAVVAMLVGTAQAVTNIDPVNTVGCWLFDTEFGVPTVPGNPATGWPPTLGAIDDSAGGDNNATAVGRLWNGTDPNTDPANYVPNLPVYAAPSTPNGSNPSSIHLSWYGGNETGAGVPPLAVQSRVECPANGDANWDLMLGNGVSYTIEAVIKPEVRGTDEGGWEGSGRHDFYEAIVADHTLVRPSDGSGTGPAWLFRTTGSDNAATQGLEFDYWANGQNRYIEVDNAVNLVDGNWHHVAVVMTSTGGGAGNWKLYVDNNQIGSKNFSDLTNVQPLDDYPPPYDNPTTDAMWIGDFLGRWDDQFIGSIDGVAFTRRALAPGLEAVDGNFVLNRTPEPSSIVLLVMGALALVAIRRVR